jgi:hypothetical protein
MILTYKSIKLKTKYFEWCDSAVQISRFKMLFYKKRGSVGFVGRSVLVLKFVFGVYTLFLSSTVS